MSRSKTYEITLTQEPVAVIERAREKATSSGVDFQGDENEGNFAGKGLLGTYRIAGPLLTITISKKPMILPWAMIESSIKSFFG